MIAHPVAPLQSAMLAATRVRPGAYIQQVELDFPHPVDPVRIGPAFRDLARRFPALCQEFSTDSHGAVVVCTAATLRLELAEDHGSAPLGVAWERCLAADRLEPITGHRVRVWQASRRVLWTFHHALLDGRSTAHIVRAWIDEVQGESLDRGAPWVPWVALPGEQAAETIRRWCAEFPPEAEEPAPVRGDPHAVARTVAADVRAMSETLGVSVHTVAQVTSALVLGRLLDRSCVVLGQVRSCAGDGTLGFGINTVPLVLPWQPREPVRTLAARVRQASHVLRDVARLAPGDWIPHVRPQTRQPWDAVLVSERGSLGELVDRVGTRVTLHERLDDPLVLAAYLGAEPRLQVESTILPQSLVAWIADAWKAAIETLAREPDAPCAAVVPVDADAATPRGDVPTAIPVAFNSSVAAHALRPALRFRGTSRTYAQLDDDVTGLAAALASGGVVTGDRVAVLVRDRVLLPIALLATHQLGAVFVPLDPDHPVGRWESLWQNARPRLLVSEIAPWNDKISWIDPRAVPTQPDGPIPPDGAATDPRTTAALLYTSGSTGTPKGVCLTGGAIVAEARALGRLCGIRTDDRVLQFASPGFDACLEEVFLALLHGAALIPREPGVLADHDLFTRFLEQEEVTVADLPTAFWRAWTAWLAERPGRFPGRLRIVIIGGESATETAMVQWRNAVPAACQLWNTYGPTEATIVATACPLHSTPPALPGDPPIGRPIGGVTVRVAGHDGTPRPPGLPGELWISGEGVSPGYWERPDLDATAFVVRDGQRWYRTGDRGALNGAGDLVFRGRMDDQLKLRGHRIEPEEIRRHAERIAGVRAAHVGLAGNPPMLVAWVVTSTAGPDVAESVKQALEAVLPPAMVPTAVVPIAALPLTSRGKVDRTRLPAPSPLPAVPVSDDPMVAWACRMFAGVLRRAPEAIDPAVDFQRQGGDSILAMELSIRLQDAGLKLEPGDLARDSSPRAIARRFYAPAVRALDRWEPLVVLRPGHQGIPPLVLIHATPGDVLGYGNLAAALPDELPCWGIVSRALHEPGRPHLALPEMARDYLDVLRTQLGDAPFALGGWCYGGLVAYEMACTLERAGKPAPLRLLLLETSCPRPAATLRALRWQLLHLRALLTLRPERRTAYLRRKIGLGPPPAPVDSPPSTPRRSATLARNMEAVARYRAGPYRRPIDLFLTTDPGIDALPLPAGGWSVLAPARTVHLSEGSHTDLLHPPHVADLARRVALLVGLPTAAS